MARSDISSWTSPSEIDQGTGLPVGPLVANQAPAQRPERVILEGRHCRLEPVSLDRHRLELFRASTPPDAAARFRYLFDPVVQSQDDMDSWLTRLEASEDPLMFAVVDKRSGKVEGRQSLMRITPEHQTIEIGNIYWGPAIAGTQVATEANYLFAGYVFDRLGYRRYEWKCDALNAPSRNAAIRFGFTFEGLFRRHMINKGRSRDTAWFSIIDEEWPSLKAAYERWLNPANFDDDGRQETRLSDLTAAALLNRG